MFGNLSNFFFLKWRKLSRKESIHHISFSKLEEAHIDESMHLSIDVMN